jgi:GlpG protein
MRQVGTLEDPRAAQAFADYLLTLGITTKVDAAARGASVWVHREEQVPRAREEFARYREAPDDPRYYSATREAQAIRRHAESLDRQHARNTHDLNGRLGDPFLGRAPVTRILIGVAVLAFVWDWIGPELGGRSLSEWLYFSRWSVSRAGQVYSDGIQAIKGGQFWRAITPIFVHANPMHLVFNLLLLAQLGRVLEARLGGLTYGLFVMGLALVSNFAQAAYPDAFTLPTARVPGDRPFGGLSGVVFGLFGFAWMRGRLDPSAGFRLSQNFVTLSLLWLVVCTLGVLGPIANTAHVAGLVAGMLGAFVALPSPPWDRS